MGHSRTYPPSGAHRWLHCLGSVRLCAVAPEQKPSGYALEGSAAHLLGEACLARGLDAVDKIGTPLAYEDEDGNRWEGLIPENMGAAVQVYVDEVRRQMAMNSNARLHIEEEVKLEWVHEELGGTLDSSVLVEDPFGRTLYINDYKHGAGVAVDVEGNPQLMIYALGELGKDNLDEVDQVVITIVQPRAAHPDGPVRIFTISAEDLIRWGREELLPGVKATCDPNAPLVPGEWCRWCNGSVLCSARTRMSAEAMFDDPMLPVAEKPVVPAVVDLSAEQMDRILTFSPMFETWLAEVKAEAKKRLEDGAENAPGQYKLVAGKGSRAWTDEAKIAVFVTEEVGLGKADVYEDPKLKSPAQMEKVFKLQKKDPALLNLYITKNSGAPTLAPLGDKRPALPPKVEVMFEADVNPFE